MKKLLIAISIILLITIFVIVWKQCKAKTTETPIPQLAPKTIVTHIEKLEIPCTSEPIIYHEAYSLSYNEKHEQANWVAYELTKNELTNNAERSNKFIIDPHVSTMTATNKDYYKSGYDKGHLAPAADMKFSAKTMKESFYFSNMSPQEPDFNRGIWKKLEEKVRDWANLYDTIYIVTGPILSEGLPSIGNNSVSVPNYFFKAILVYTQNQQQGIGFIMENKKLSEPIYSYTVSINEIEKQIHYDLFCKLPDSIEQKIEREKNVDVWK